MSTVSFDVMTTRTLRARIREHDGDRLVLAPAGNAYELAFVVDGVVQAEIGQRVSGHVEAIALAVHAAEAGGQFIEPVQGQPRIVAGRVVEIDAAASRVLLDSVVPITLTIRTHDDLSHCVEGGFVNCHVESGAVFVLEDAGGG